ncbi:DNA helicase [Brachyspira hyodysenteriae]|uniref:DNA helicase n=1 Tax=Brachyspira hyodysenteriae ATCC 27164 TaxID=1266923 RepID=A0A3B6VXF2_BRAHO|nr:AAA domain-containing protein [Brachyspira hyodysenteriae]ANN63306.1 DNA helicase [Brachyspira hyodysenteriae ATCC 27164]KLI24366.1 DNA helicase [Brachyspira hyodysenteriae]MCZ9925604.1 AAA domain-containing protein [Brachyspira hyodysenteriae]TVL78288.1 DNA helicase [Brachyspira hyodysenteriae]TVL86241.1 DNA helicase [Brachyspira hyodysenteriae]
MKFFEYLNEWEKYLSKLLEKYEDKKEDGDYTKYLRQLKSIENVRSGIFMSVNLFNTIKNNYDNTLNNIQNNKKVRNIYPIQEIYKNNNQVFNIIEKAVNSRELFCLMGPPGTGKTTAIVEIILQTIKKNPIAKIAICSETHVAVDNAIERLNFEIENRNIHCSIMRYEEFKNEYDNENLNIRYKDYIDSWKKKLESAYDESFRNKLFNEFEEHIINNKKYHKYICENSNIIGITCNQMARFKLDELDDPYDLIIIDEVSKNTLPEILIPALFAKKLILVGDPNQLPPVFCKDEIETMSEIDTNLQNELIDNSLVDKLFRNVDKDTMFGMLDTQYRMEAKIGDIVSKCFYNGELKNGTEYSDDKSIYWLDYDTNKRFPYNYGGELYNPIEVELINDSIENLNIDSDTSIAIITPYKKQKRELKNVINNNEKLKSLNIEIDTIDAFQGKEADIVYFSVVRNTGSTRFFSNIKRLNVAISRTKKRLYMVGMSKYCNKVDILKNIYSSSKVLI